ncbi:MAG: hypothetical protein FJY95_03465 [Candidatus Handelsmanbacteria bacterium]|nr:hypothetical protein [Candidatus Handelsmanbacteria bacterium]
MHDIGIERGDETSPVWIEVARGQAPVPARAGSFFLCLPGQPEHPIPAAELGKISAALL